MPIEDLRTKLDLERFIDERLTDIPLNSINGMPESLMPTPWAEGALQNSWTPYIDAEYNLGAFYRQTPGGLVSLKGLVAKAAGAAGTTVFTLPENFRPSKNLVCMALRDGVFERVNVGASGAVQYLGAAGAVGWLSLDSIHFWAGA